MPQMSPMVWVIYPIILFFVMIFVLSNLPVESVVYYGKENGSEMEGEKKVW